MRIRALAALWLVAAATSVITGTCEERARRDELPPRVTRSLPAAPDSIGDFRFRHQWSESHGSPRPRLTGQTVDTTLAYADLRRMTNAFGVPEPWTSVRAFDWIALEGPREARRRRAELIRRAAERGVTISFDEDTIFSGPDYDWILRQSRDDVRNVAKQLAAAYRKSGLNTERGFHREVASFVQSIEYAIPEASRRTENGVEFWTFGIATPIEVLHNKWGDCDSKCLLFASLLRNFPDQRVIFLVGNDHMFAGVRDAVRPGDRYVEVQGVRYVLIELTGLWPFGRIPKDLWRGVARNEFKIRRV